MPGRVQRLTPAHFRAELVALFRTAVDECRGLEDLQRAGHGVFATEFVLHQGEWQLRRRMVHDTALVNGTTLVELQEMGV